MDIGGLKKAGRLSLWYKLTKQDIISFSGNTYGITREEMVDLISSYKTNKKGFSVFTQQSLPTILTEPRTRFIRSA